MDASVLFPVELDVAEDLAPERGEPVGVGGVEDQLTDAGCHGRQCTETIRESIIGRALEPGAGEGGASGTRP
ncbi:hypothetical protein GCM10022214_50040 [Actinomadura miaoliensis]|uniref:Uncharacterized protein n=1 Tax=Actinomadura miaoliensis TaxID=430685 RepID=A0ABP7W9W1_9ACTN